MWHCDFNLYILTVYRPPKGDFDAFLANIEEILNRLGTNKKIILAGDFNVHFGTNENEAVALCDIMQSFGFKQTINVPTRLLNCLDNIFINFSDNSMLASVVDLSISDH